MAPALVTLLSA